MPEGHNSSLPLLVEKSERQSCV